MNVFLNETDCRLGWSVLSFYDFAQAILVANHKIDGRIVALHKVDDVKRFVENEKRATEGVSNFEFGVFRFLDNEAAFAQIAENAMAVGFPRYFNVFVFMEFCNIDVWRAYPIGLHFAVW